MAFTSQVLGAVLQVDGRATEGGVLEIVPGARLLLDVGVDSVEGGALLDDIAAAVDTAAASAESATASAVAAAAITGIDSTDSAVAALVGTTAGPETQAALSATYVRGVNPEGFGATGDGATNDTAAFTAAATQAAAQGLPLVVPEPTASYRLNSNPTIPDNLTVIASPHWFSGAGKMPFHLYTEISEGVDPRVFSTKVMGYAEAESGEDRRKWAVVGWVNYKNAPDPTAAAAQEADLVGVDGRGVVSVPNGRVWALLGLAHMTSGAKSDGSYGVSQAYAAELDVNNNTGDDSNLDGAGNTPLVLGLSIVSGGTNRPAEAIRIDATRKPPGDSFGDDNRWHTALRVRGDVVKEYAVLLDDGFEGVFARIPTGCDGIQWTSGGAVRFVEYQDGTDQRRKMWSQAAGSGYDIINSFGTSVLSTHDGSVQAGVPLRRKSVVLPATATINANLADHQILTSGVTTVTGISGGYDGQRLTLVNVTGGTLTVTEDSDMRMVGSNFSMTDASTIEFIYSAPTWFEVSRSTNS